MLRARARAKIEKAHRWGGRSVRGWAVVAVAFVGVGLLILRVFAEFHHFSIAGVDVPPKEGSAFHSGFDLVTGLLASFALMGAGFLYFIFWPITTFRSPYKREAIKRPEELVQTAGTIIGQVVGRDDLCKAIMEDLRDPRTRRPHVIVGGVGVGKTAMLVRLTTLLAQKGAVPVPLRLRDYATKLDFRQAAHDRFCNLAALLKFDTTKADKIWQQLRKDNKIVVLADGLEEALQDLGPHENERDNMIRVAIHDARKERLPLVIASRPHAPLRGMEASMTELEPLSERDALQHLRRHGRTDEDARLQWIVEAADVSESPLYLQITDELNKADLLHRLTPRYDRHRLDTRGADRVGLRVRLLQTWVDAVTDGYLHEDSRLGSNERKAAVEQLSALACAGLKKDSLYVRFADFSVSMKDLPSDADEKEKAKLEKQCEENRRIYREVHKELNRKLHGLQQRLDLELAAAYGQQLGLVEPHRDGVRFPHSIMQAYLGSRYVGIALRNKDYRESALKQPGRELLISLVMYTRRCETEVSRDVSRQEANRIITILHDAARTRGLGRHGTTISRLDVKTVDLYASTAQIVPETGQARFADLVAEIGKLVCRTQTDPEKIFDDSRALEAARLQFVQQLGEAMRRTENIRHEEDLQKKLSHDDLRQAYRELFKLSACEPFYAVRVAAAQEMGAGGGLAYEALQGSLAPFPSLFGADVRRMQQDVNSGEREREERQLRDQIMRAWLLPMLVASIIPADAPDLSRQARKDLEDWVEYAAGSAHPGLFPFNLKIALAQGFKYAANQRPLNPYSQAESRAYLAELAKDMLHRVDFWYSRLALLHALTLWSLPDGLDETGSDQQSRRANGQEEARRHGQTQSPDALVKQWLVMRDDEAKRVLKGSRTEHPFVDQAAHLCILALESRQPERFLWIDESGVLSKTGSGPATAPAFSRRRLWIPPSAGWSGLDPCAQQLVADVLVYLNLTEGDCSPKERERRLGRTATAVLPSCLTKDRGPLDPTRTIRVERQPGLHPRCASDCLLDLCPYPLKNQQHRAELSEAFCRRQRVILGFRGRIKALRFRATAPWQGETRTHLKHFWDDMGERSRR